MVWLDSGLLRLIDMPRAAFEEGRHFDIIGSAWYGLPGCLLVPWSVAPFPLKTCEGYNINPIIRYHLL